MSNWVGSLGAVAVITAAQLIPTAPAFSIGGGGKASTDCLAVFDATANVPVSKPRNIRCADGDPACDADGVANGRCQFPVAVWANSTFDSRCTLAGVQFLTISHAQDNGDPKFDPDFQALQTRVDSAIDPPTSAADRCTSPTNFLVTVKGPFKKASGANFCQSNSKVLQLTTIGIVNGQDYTDNDTLKMTCDPEPTACDPRLLYTGTFDRIQRQVFNQSCAKSSCHDSQTSAADLLLEVGAAYGNLVDVVPYNPVASNPPYSWLRIVTLGPTSGDPDGSFLYRKVSGKLPDGGMGARMPRNSPKLHSTLIEVIRLWIESGAPPLGWVPGTD